MHLTKMFNMYLCKHSSCVLKKMFDVYLKNVQHVYENDFFLKHKNGGENTEKWKKYIA